MASNTFIFNVPQPIKKPYSELIKDGKHGCLKRKQTKFGRVTWESKNVVVRDGCLYIFKNERCQSYEKAFTLFGYNEISKAQEVETKEAPYPFKICYALDSKEQVKYFSADSVFNRAEWMIAIKKEMLRVHKIETSLGTDSDRSSDDTDVPISSRDFFDRIQSNYRVDNDSDLESEDMENPKPNIPQPPEVIPVNIPVNLGNGHFGRPNVPPKPSKEKQTLESLARWNGTPGEGKRFLLKYGREGSYMIRSSADGCDALLVISEYQAKKYKIFRENKKSYLGGKSFDNIDSLILYYQSHNVPRTQTPLKVPYTTLRR